MPSPPHFSGMGTPKNGVGDQKNIAENIVGASRQKKIEQTNTPKFLPCCVPKHGGLDLSRQKREFVLPTHPIHLGSLAEGL